MQDAMDGKEKEREEKNREMRKKYERNSEPVCRCDQLPCQKKESSDETAG